MTNPLSIRHRFGLTLLFALALPLLAQAAEPLPSWNDGPSKKNIIEFVQTVTDPSSKDFVKPEDRIAVFDNDGTLWSEQPMYFELLFALEEVKRTAPQHPEWKTTQPFQAVLENDHKALAASGLDGLMKIFGATHTGMTTEAFDDYAKTWLSSGQASEDRQAVHRDGVPADAGNARLPAQPGLQDLHRFRRRHRVHARLRREGLRHPARASHRYYVCHSVPVQGRQTSILRTPKLAHNDDGPGKPESIDAVIGKRPIFAFGNSDGDLQMLQWTAAGPGKRFMGLVHHTDAKREWAYDRKSDIGRLDKALDEANSRGWTVVDMAAEWRRIYPYDSATPEQVQYKKRNAGPQ